MPKRGLIVLIVVWSVLLLAPMFRVQSRKTIPKIGAENSNILVVSEDWTDIEKANPNNALLAFRALQDQSDPKPPQYFRDLDALVARFPDDLSLRRARIMESPRLGRLVRIIYTNDSVPAANSRTDLKPPTSEQRAALVRAARAGEKQAPDDGFFPWMEAMALWDRGEEPALRALERAAKTSNFDDGGMANARALIRLRETQNPLDAYDKIAQTSGVIFPHYAIMREMARQVTWSGIEHYKRGDKAGAYRRWRAIAQASGAFRRSQSGGPESSVIGVFVAEAMERLVWGNVADEFNTPAKVKASGVPAADANEARTAARLRAFVELARRDGQNEIAAYALREDASFEGQKLSRATLDYLDKLGFESPITMGSLQLPWVGRLVFWLSVAGGLGLLVCLVWRLRVGGARWFGASGAQIAFFSALWLGVLALAFWGRTASQLQQFGGYNDDATPLSVPSLMLSLFDNPGIVWAYIVGTLALSVALCYWGSIREMERLQSQILPQDKAATSGAWWPKLTVFAWFLVAMNTTYGFAVTSGTIAQLAVWIACALLALGLSFARIERDNATSRTRSRLMLVSTICGLISIGLAATFGISSDSSALYVAATSLFVALAILIYLAANSRGWRANFAPALAVALQTLGGVAVVCAVAFFIASLAELPIRARQNRVVDDYIARGEIDWMKSQLAIQQVAENQS